MSVHRVAGVVAAAVLLGMLLSSRSVAAQTRPQPEATQHALDELGNALAQGKITLTPTPSPAPTRPPPSPTPRPSAVPPTDTPRPEPTDTPTVSEPALPVPSMGKAAAAYVRPSPRDPNGIWLELATLQGRWSVRYDATLCTPPTTWTNVWLALDEQSDRPITVSRDDDDGAMCAFAQWSWTSDVPCAANDQGACDVQGDGAYWEAMAHAQPPAQAEPPTPAEQTAQGDSSPQVEPPPQAEATTQVEPVATDTPTAVPIPAPAPPLAPPPPPPPAAVPPAPAAPPPATVQPRQAAAQPVIVIVTATPIATASTMATSTSLPTLTTTPTPTETSMPTLEPTSTEIPLFAAGLSATQEPTLVAHTDDTASAPTEWNWTLTFVVLSVALGLVAVWLFVARSGPVMW